MERMIISVESTRLDDAGKTVIGMVTAKSARKIGREHIVSIAMVVRLDAYQDEKPAVTRRRVKDEAMLFLDAE